MLYKNFNSKLVILQTITILLPLSAGCTFDTSGYMAGAFGFIDDAGISHDPATSPGGEGGTGETPNDGLNTKNSNSETCKDLICPLGCSSKEQRCYRLQPTNLFLSDLESNYDQVDFDFVVAKDTTAQINTSTGQIILPNLNNPPTTITRYSNGLVPSGGKNLYLGVQQQISGAPEIMVVMVNNLILETGTQTKLVIEGSRAIAFYVRNEVKIDGRIVLGGSKNVAGPGGFSGGATSNMSGSFCYGGEGKNGRQENALSVFGNDSGSSGGGGGGHRGTGGDGAEGYTDHSVSVAQGNGGGTDRGQDQLSPLIGGCGGGAGGGGKEMRIDGGVSETIEGVGGFGGGGGGAIQISANKSIRIGISDEEGMLSGISAPGLGGGAGDKGGGGGGGGAGGAILLEAPLIEIGVSGFIAANGGGGGAGALGLFHKVSASAEGSEGVFTFGQFTAGGGTGGDNGAFGGAGGGYGHEDGVSSENPSLKPNGGGGGGSAGRIRLNFLQRINNNDTSTYASPAASEKNQINNRW